MVDVQKRRDKKSIAKKGRTRHESTGKAWGKDEIPRETWSPPYDYALKQTTLTGHHHLTDTTLLCPPLRVCLLPHAHLLPLLCLAPSPAPAMAWPQQEAIDTFIGITGADEAVAVRKLEVPPNSPRPLPPIPLLDSSARPPNLAQSVRPTAVDLAAPCTDRSVLGGCSAVVGRA
jgi:hypothetical protein